LVGQSRGKKKPERHCSKRGEGTEDGETLTAQIEKGRRYTKEKCEQKTTREQKGKNSSREERKEPKKKRSAANNESKWRTKGPKKRGVRFQKKTKKRIHVEIRKKKGQGGEIERGQEPQVE